MKKRETLQRVCVYPLCSFPNGSMWSRTLMFVYVFLFYSSGSSCSGESFQISSEGMETKTKNNWEWEWFSQQERWASAFSGSTVASPGTTRASNRSLWLWAPAGVFQRDGASRRQCSRDLKLQETLYLGGLWEVSHPFFTDAGVSVNLCWSTASAGNSPVLKSFQNWECEKVLSPDRRAGPCFLVRVTFLPRPPLC